MEKTKLSSLTRGLLDAVQDASAVAGQQHFHILRTFFYQEGDRMIPRTVRIQVDDGRVMDVPMICLVNPASYRLEHLKIEMSALMSEDQVKQAVSEGKSEARRGSYAVSVCPKGRRKSGRSSDLIDIEILFKAEDSPEGVGRVLEELTNTMRVQPEGVGPEETRFTIDDHGVSKHSHSSSSSEPTSSSSSEEVIKPFQ